MNKHGVFCIGLTGGIACGKSVALTYFMTKGVVVIDCDLIARSCAAPGTAIHHQIMSYFGLQLQPQEDAYNRRLIRTLITQDPDKKHWLESLLHPLIRTQVHQEAMRIKQGPYYIIDCPILNAQNSSVFKVDRTCYVHAHVKKQLARLIKRDGLSKKEATKMISMQSQASITMQQADDCLDNNSTLSALKKQIDQLHQSYCHLS
jgi:dephospho-CoA kinase